jgi:cytochrome c5
MSVFMKKALALLTGALLSVIVVAAPSTAPGKAEQVGIYPAHIQAMIDRNANLVGRINPFGTVCIEGYECAVKVSKGLAPAVEGEIRAGNVIYEGVCANCHAAGLIGAPKYGDKAQWSARLGKGTATLYTHAINGFNAMPAKGGAEIPDQEVKNAVDYMVAAVR